MTTQTQLTVSALESGEAGNPARLMPYLDIFCPPFADFNIESTPLGMAPDRIREAWIGLSLPVRCEAVGGIAILGSEAVFTLEQSGKDEAAEWWKNYYRKKYSFISQNREEDTSYLIASMSTLVFNAACGVLERR